MSTLNGREGWPNALDKKTCSVCGETKPIEEFAAKDILNGKRYHRSRCKLCDAVRRKERDYEPPGSIPAEQICRVCGIPKPIEEFGRQRGKVRAVCRKCDSEQSLARYYRRKKKKKAVEPPEAELPGIDAFAKALVEISRWRRERVEQTGMKEFLDQINGWKAFRKSGFGYRAIKKAALNLLDQRGFSLPEDTELEPGTYLIVAESHGKHVKRRTMQLVQNLQKVIRPAKVIHIGHMLDDDNDVSYLWHDVKDLLVVTRLEEQAVLSRHGFDAVRNSVTIGNWRVMNQDIYQDYVKTYTGSIDPMLFPGNTIIDRHLHERHTFTSEAGDFITVACGGCLCEKHIIKTIRQIDFTDRYQVKQAYPEGFVKYRRARHMYDYWEQGFIVLHVDKDGDGWIEQLRIHTLPDGTKVTAWGGDIITSDAKRYVREPEATALVITDTHAPYHDPSAMAVQAALADLIHPDYTVDLGDFHDMRAVNPHLQRRSSWRQMRDVDFLEDLAVCRWLLKRRESWSEERYLLFANHERFIEDFIDRYPQFEKLLDVGFLTGGSVELVPHKDKLQHGTAMYVHGDQKMYGAPGRLAEKLARVYRPQGCGAILYGHIHRPSIRFGAYSVGLSGDLDQLYNEWQCSNWAHGAAAVTHFGDCSFVQLLDIRHARSVFGGDWVAADDAASWEGPAHWAARLSFEFQEA